MKFIIRIILILILVVAVIELYLHIAPTSPKTQENTSAVFTPNKSFEWHNTKNIEALDSIVSYTSNSLGFKGEEPPENNNSTKVIFMGSSTTYGKYLNIDKNWTTLTTQKITENNKHIWFNNAAADNLTTAQCLELLKNKIIPLKPSLIILTTGFNEIEKHSVFFKPAPTKNTKYQFKIIELFNSYFFSKDTLYNSDDLPKKIDIKQAPKLALSNQQILSIIEGEQSRLTSYRDTLYEIISTCNKNKIKVVLLSLPILFSDDTDLFTNTYLGDIQIGDANAKALGLLLRQYNKINFDIGNQLNIPYINLATRMPKDSRFYYDGIHFNNEGAEIVAQFIADELKELQIIK